MSKLKLGTEASTDRPPLDRAAEAPTFATSNLVKPDIRSRARQQSEPPPNRTVFPPTPPPESDKSPLSARSSGIGSGPSTGRAASMRNGGRPPRLDLSKTRESDRDRDRDRDRDKDREREKLRIGTMRTASEPRGPSRNYGSSSYSYGNRYRLEDDSPYRQGGMSDEEVDDEYPGELYDMYRAPTSRSKPMPRRMESRSRQRPRYIEEEDEYGSEVDDGLSVDEDDFEMVSGSQPYRQPSRKQSRAGSRRPEVSKV